MTSKKDIKVPWNKPLTVGLDVTDRCNLDCLYCYAYPCQNVLYPKSLIFKTVDRIFEQIEPLEVGIGGGDPFVRNDIFEIIDYVLNYLPTVAISTNGTLMNKETIEKIKSYKNSIDLQISIDSYDPNIHNKVRGMYEITVNNIKRLIEEDIRFAIGIVVTKINVNTVFDTILYFSEMGVRNFHLMNLMPSYKATLYWDKLALSEKEIRTFWNKFEKWYRTAITTGTLPQDVVIDYPSPPKENVDLDTDEEIHIPGCLAGISRITVLGDGTVIPCDVLRIPLGNILKESWNDIKQKAIYKELSEIPIGKCSLNFIFSSKKVVPELLTEQEIIDAIKQLKSRFSY